LPLVAFCFTFKDYLYFGLFEDVGYVSTFRVVINESDTFVVVVFVFVCVLRCICAVSLAMS